MTDAPPTRYDRSVLLTAYLDAVQAFSSLEWMTKPEAQTENADWLPDAIARANSRIAYFAGLEKLFGADLGLPDPLSGSGEVHDRVRQRFLLRAARDYDAIRTPFDGYMEAGLLVKALEGVGIWDAVSDCAARMQGPAATLREQYLELLDIVLSGLLGEQADAVYELDDPAAVAIVVPEPWDPWEV